MLTNQNQNHLRLRRHGPPAASKPSAEPPPPGEEELRTIPLAAGGRGAGVEELRWRSQALTEETLQRLESVHNQQITLQNQLLDSALRLAVTPQAPPPMAVAPPCRCNLATLRSSQEECTAARHTPMANRSAGEAGLMEVEQLRTALTERAGSGAAQPPKNPGAKPSRPFQTQPRRAKASPLSERRAVRKPQLTRGLAQVPDPKISQTRPPQTAGAAELRRPRTAPTHRANPDELPAAAREPDNAEAEDQIQGEDSDKVLSVNQERGGEEPHLQQCQENYNQYLQDRIETKQNDVEMFGGEKKKGHVQGKENMVSSKQGLLLGSAAALPGLRSGSGGPLSGPEVPGRPGGLPPGPCLTLDKARLVLRRVQRQRKVLEENLESQLRARSEELLHCRLDALTQNRDCTDEIRIKKTVDSLIRDSQAGMERTVARTKDLANGNAGGKRKPAPIANKNTAGRRDPAPSGRPLKSNTTPSRSHQKSFADLDFHVEPLHDAVLDPDECLRRLYGKAPHEGQRRSLKRSQYLRLNSPVSPDRSRPRPCLVQSVRGVKLKSCKTQTLAPGPYPGFSPGPSPGPSPNMIQGPVWSGEGFPAVAIPLGRPRTGPSHRAVQEMASLSRAPPPPPLQQEVTSHWPTLAPEEESRTKKRVEQSADPVLVHPSIHILQASPQQEESLADVEQCEAGLEEVRSEAGSEEPLQLEGGPGPDPVQYQGPRFPPQPLDPCPPLVQERSLQLDLDLQREALEQSLVLWVEQQLMSRIMLDMYHPPLSDPTHLPYVGLSEPEPAHAPSLVQSEAIAASDHGRGSSGRLQLHVESGLDLDQEQVRGLVLEVLTEVVALFLGSRESQEPQTGPGMEPEPEPDPGAGAETGLMQQSLTETQEVLIPTPQATPPQTPPPTAQSPPPTAQSPIATPIATPLPSDRPDTKDDLPPEPVATPPPTPPVTCPDADPPLVQTQKEEEPEASPPPDPGPTPAAVAHPPGPPSPPDASSSCTSSSSSSSGTEVTAPRHISEGELLLSRRYLQALHEENSSFSSSLHELQEMELDPPSEGQVHSSILLSFISKLQEREPRPQPEGAWGQGLEEEEEQLSAGEIQDVTNQSRSLRQTNPITGEALEQTNHSALSEGQLTLDPLDIPLAQDLQPQQTQASPPDQDLNKDQDHEPSRTIQELQYAQPQKTHQIQDSPPDQGRDLDQDQNQNQERENGVGEAEGGPALVKMEVFLPSVETAENSGGSDSFSDTF